MPPHTRSQRRRQPTRNQPRPTASAETTSPEPSIGPTIPLEPPTIAPPSMSASTPTRQGRVSRRVISRPAPEPIDYSKDYAAARLDLRRIVLWALLLFVAMVALKFSGVV
ncbi:MAG: hypothetical protein IPO81_23595 [Kouleothrix sp.]|nr:hypothetical protein [Kouleothrix sp.]